MRRGARPAWLAPERLRGAPWLLVAVLTVGAIVRAGALLAYQPAALMLHDPTYYIGQAGGSLFGDALHLASRPRRATSGRRSRWAGAAAWRCC